MEVLGCDKPKYLFDFKILENPAIGIAIQKADAGEGVPIFSKRFF